MKTGSEFLDSAFSCPFRVVHVMRGFLLVFVLLVLLVLVPCIPWLGLENRENESRTTE